MIDAVVTTPVALVKVINTFPGLFVSGAHSTVLPSGRNSLPVGSALVPKMSLYICELIWLCNACIMICDVAVLELCGVGAGRGTLFIIAEVSEGLAPGKIPAFCP